MRPATLGPGVTTTALSLVTQVAPHLLAEPGVGVLIAAKLIGEIAGIDRFTSEIRRDASARPRRAPGH